MARFPRHRPPVLQLTVASAVKVEGVGLHSGEKCAVLISPAREPEGIVFRVGEDDISIPATTASVAHWERQTALVASGGSVGMVEHLLAALSGLGILHAVIHVAGPEVPAMDGSALPFVEAIEGAGTAEIAEPAPRRAITSPLVVEERGARLSAAPSGSYSISASVEYPHVGQQKLSLELTPETFKKELAPARTFGFKEEAQAILASGLAAGASLENVVLVDRGEYSAPLRFPDELVRHKMLDIVGDLSLVGGPFDAHVEAVRPGHRANIQLARAIASALEAGSNNSPRHE